MQSDMSIRANPRAAAPTNVSSPMMPISFKDEFAHSAAALAANHEETVSHILSRLDQLQNKIQTQPEQNSEKSTPAPRSVSSSASNQRSGGAAVPTDTSVHARLATLEGVNENVLNRLSSKLDAVENQLRINRDSEALMTQIATRLQQVEPKLQSHANLGDRLSRIETQLQTHVGRVSNLEARSDRPDPGQERVLARINSKLDALEDQQRQGRSVGAAAASQKTEQMRSTADSRRSLDAGGGTRSNRQPMELDMDREERALYLQTRIEKLKELRSKYENSDAA